MIKIENLSIEEKKIVKTKELDAISDSMKEFGIENPYDMLPKKKWHIVSFDLTNTHTGFAHGIYRVLVEEMEVLCSTTLEEHIVTDDEFISNKIDRLIKNINLLPINQSLTDEELSKLDVFLYKYNDTDDIIDIKASDFIVTNKSKKKKGGLQTKSEDEPQQKLKKGTIKGSKIGGKIMKKTAGVESDEEDNEEEEETKIKGDMDISHIYPESNSLVVRLRPGKYLKVNHLLFERGMQKDDAARFSLLNNIRYKPIDIIPYNIFAKTTEERGTRSIEHDSKEFNIQFTTCGNITPKEVIKLVYNRLNKELNLIKDRLMKYSKTDITKKYYNDEGIEVANKNELYTYTLYGQYLTTVNMISQRCYLLEPSILYCAQAVKRFDNEIGIIRLIHADPNKLLISAIDACLDDLEIVKAAFDKK
jgi:hypothetical protein